MAARAIHDTNNSTSLESSRSSPRPRSEKPWAKDKRGTEMNSDEGPSAIRAGPNADKVKQPRWRIGHATPNDDSICPLHHGLITNKPFTPRRQDHSPSVEKRDRLSFCHSPLASRKLRPTSGWMRAQARRTGVAANEQLTAREPGLRRSETRSRRT